MTKIKRVVRRVLRLSARVLRKIDRSIQRGFTRLFRSLYKIKFLRPVTKKIYRFVHYHYRISAAVMAVLVVMGISIPVLQPYLRSQRYELNAHAQELLGKADQDLTKKLTFDDQKQLFQFNKDAKKDSTTEGNPLEKLKSQVGGGGEGDEQLYSVDISKDLSKGVTYYDNQMQLSFKLTPQFSTMPGEQKAGHLVYPLNGAKGQLAYTVDAGSMKENVVLYKSPGDTFSMSYRLDLPKSLEARLIPETGEVGIYSADPALFGNISYGTSDDQAKVEAARNSSEKTYLTFKIPAPVVMGLGKTDQRSIAPIQSRFELSGDTLRVVTTGLDKAEYPLSIDPTISIDSSSDFQSGNMEDANLSVNSGDLNRGALTGGSVGSWTASSTSLPTTYYYHTTTAYNGFLYVVNTNSIRYIDITSGGSLGASWSTGPSLTASKTQHSAVAYNGYLYILAGNSSSVPTDTVYFIKINSDGSLTGNTWKQANSLLNGGRNTGDAFAYNGRIYFLGGNKGSAGTACSGGASSSYCNDVQYAEANADGSLGTWQSTTGFTTPRYGHRSIVYNGYAYIIGGNGGSTLNDVQYAPINANGTISNSAWKTTSAFTTARYYFGATVYNGYIYISGGNTTYLSDTQYAPINANGTLGAWSTTTTFTTPRYGHTMFAYNGFIYVTGGLKSGTSTACSAPTSSSACSDVQYAIPDPPGETTGYTTSGSTFTNARYNHATVTYNGYIYVLGGRNGGTYYNDIRFASLNNNGTIGTWNVAANLFSYGREGLSAVAYNGYMYILGGRKGTTDANCRTTGSAIWCNDVQKSLIGSNGNLGAWSSAGTGFTTPRWMQSAVMANGFLYVIAGSGGPVLSDVRYAPICTGENIVSGCTTSSTKGNVGNWGTANSISTARYAQSAVAYNGYIYVTGGDQNGITANCRSSGSGSLCNDVQWAPICTGLNTISTCTTSSTPGSLGNWSPANTNFFPGVRSSHVSVAANGNLYVMGGGDGSSYLSDVQYAPINSDGSLGAWDTNGTVSLPAARATMSAAVYNGYVYITGGATSGVENTAIYAAFNNGGSGVVGSWTGSGSFTTARYRHATAVYNGYLYISGGVKPSASNNCSTVTSIYCNDVQFAVLNRDGSLTWQSSSSSNFDYTRNGHAMTAYNGYLYIMGGQKDGTNTTCSGSTSSPNCSDVQFAPICTGINTVQGCSNLSAAGSLGTWVATTSLGTNTSGGTNSGLYGPSAPRTSLSAVAYNGYVYALGGQNGSYFDTVQYALICTGSNTTSGCTTSSTPGSLGNWTATSKFSGARGTQVSFVYNGYIYIAGGYEVGADVFYNDVQYAPLDPSTGAVGTWNQTSAFNIPRQYQAVAVSNGYVYLLGGVDNTVVYNDVQFAAINANGTLGPWQHSTAFSTERYGLGAAAYNGYLYVAGGADTNDTRLATTQYVPLSVIPRKALYSKLIDLSVPSLVSSITYTGVLPGDLRSIKYRVAGSDGVFGSATNLSDGLSCNVSAGQYIQLLVTLDDSETGVFRDALGADATLSSVTVTSTPLNTPPNKRLRHGAWFLNEVQQPFDINTINCS